MKADLANREPEMLAAWERDDVYGKIRDAAKGRPAFILTDGPPYANGAIHLGHALNKILKDIIVKSRTLDGYDAPYVPGWDCHGLPIEMQVEKTHGRVGQKIDAKAFRAACREYAHKQVDAQRADFKRFGVLGDWDHPYLTMAPRFEADQLRAFALIIKNGHVYKGYKPVHWCLNCRSALAEAEVEYEDKTSPEHLCALSGGRSRRFGAPLRDRARASSRAVGRADVACHLDHHALDLARESRGGGASAIRLCAGRIRFGRQASSGWCWPSELVDAVMKSLGVDEWVVIAHRQGRGARASAAAAPFL